MSLLALLAILWNYGKCQALTPNVAPPLSGSEKADIVFALHLSDRANAREVRTVLNYLNSLISGSDVENGRVQIGLLTYSADAEVIFQINQYSSVPLIRNEVLRTESRERSRNVDSSAALSVGTQMLDFIYSGRRDAPKALIFVTDSVSTENAELIPFAHLIVETEQVNVFSIGIGLNGKEELEDLATAPKNVLTVSGYSELPSTIDDLKRKIFAFGTRGEKAVPETGNLESTKPEPRKEGEPKAPACGLAKVDLVIILDASTSVSEPNYKKMLAFCKDFLKDADIDSGSVRVGIVIYSTSAQIQFHLKRYSTKAEVFAAIDKIPYIYGSTNTADGLNTMRTKMFTLTNGGRRDVNNIAMIITDGISNINARRTIPEAENARAAGIHIYAIGIGLSDTKELNAMASPPASENSFSVKEFDELAGLAEKIFSSVCPGTNTRSPPATTKTTTSVSTTTLTTATKKLTTSTTTTKPPPTVAPACGLAKVDLVIVLDASTSVTEPNYKMMLSFCKDFLKDADIDSGSVRVGVVIYSTDVQVQFHLNRHSTKAAVFQAIDSIPYIYGSTNTADGLKTMRTQMFSQDNGDRPDVENIALVMTDGISNINARRTIPEAEQARAAGIHIYGIGIGLSDTKELDAIATPPARENSFAVQDFNELAGLVVKRFSSICPVVASTPAPETCGLGKVDLVFILDASSSVTEANYKKLLTFCKDFLGNVDIDSGSVRVGVVIYSTEVAIQLHLNRYSKKTNLFAAIDKIPYIYGSTNTADGLRTMRTEMFTVANGDRPDVDNVAIVITDGILNINARRTVPEAVQARAIGIHIYAIGIGLTDSKELDAIASEPAKENSFSIQEFDELVGLENKIFSSICQATPAPATTTATNLKSTTKPECELSKVDLVFVLNASTSLTEAKFVKMLNFVKSFLTGAAVDNGNVRVGALILGTEVSIQFHLNEYSDKASLFKSIENIPYIYDSTSTADGLEAMYYQMFTEDKGDRPDVPNIAVAITDGISNINARRTILEAEDARAAGIYLYAIGIELVGDKELIGIIFKPAGDNTFSVQNFDELAGLEKMIFSSICPATLPATTTTTIRISSSAPDPSACDENPCRNDGRCEPTTSGPVCKCTGGYRGNYCEMSCVSRKDIIFVLDSSSSVGEENFELALEFVSSVVEELSRGGSDNRHALITFSNDVHLVFSLGRYSSESMVLNAIKYTQYRPGSTNTAGGLRTALEISSPEYGDRQDVDNIVMLVAGGQSNVNTQDTIPASDDLKKTGAKIMTIGVGLSNYKELESIGSGSENVYKVNTYNLLGDVKAEMLENSCSGNE